MCASLFLRDSSSTQQAGAYLMWRGKECSSEMFFRGEWGLHKVESADTQKRFQW